MAKPTYDTTAEWVEVSLDLLSGDARKAYDEYKLKAIEAGVAKAIFETAFTAFAPPLPSTQHYGFGYRFGKLSIAVLDGPPGPARKAVVAKPAPRSLADLLGVRSI